MRTKIIAQILALCMIMSALAACSDSGSEDAGTPKDTAANQTDTGGDEATAETSILDTLSAGDFGGATLTVFTKADSWWQITRLDAPEITGEVINDAMYNRNVDFETRYNTTLNIISTPDSMTATIRNTVTSGASDYDFVLPSLSELAVLAAEDALFDLHKVDAIDFTNKAWDQNAVSFYSIANKLYYGVSDISLGKNECAWIYMFNKRLLEEFNLEDPYTLVKENKWTFDKSLEMMQAASMDLNGNGQVDNEDMFGLATHDINYYALLISAGEVFAAKDENDLPYMDVSTDKFITIFDKLKNQFTAKEQTVMEYQLETFVAGRALLCAQVMACVRLNRDMEDDFGIIPTPMYDESQGRYFTYVIPYDVYGASIPITANDKEVSGSAIQALAVLSSHYLTPAYYDVTITGKGLRDESSIEMLDIILSSTVYDIARMYDWGGFASGIAASISTKSEFASSYARKEKAIGKAIEKTITQFTENKN